MNTAEMWLAAQTDGHTYKCSEQSMLYSKDTGLINDGIYNNTIDLGDFDCSFNKFMSYKWHVAEDVMTIAEAEKKFGIKIIRN